MNRVGMSRGPACAGRRALRSAILVGILGLAAGCNDSELSLRLPADLQWPPRSLHVFFVDGIRTQTLDRMLAAGELPNIHEHFVRGGVRIRDTVVCLPSITYSNTVSLLTGVSPADHGIVNNDWWDPQTHTYRNYRNASGYATVNRDFRALTLHERIAGFTANLKCPARRGADFHEGFPLATGLAWLTQDYSTADRAGGNQFMRIVAEARRRQRWPTLTVQYFPGVDLVAHTRGSDSPAYERALRVADEQIGRVARALQNSALRDRLYLALVTDHSHMPIPPEHRVDLHADLQRATGQRIDDPSAGTSGGGVVRRDSPCVMIRASRMATIDLQLGGRRVPGSSGEPSQGRAELLADWIGRLVRLPEVGLVCWLGPEGVVRVESRFGQAQVESAIVGGSRATILRLLKGDPLSDGTVPSRTRFADVEHSADDWLARTHADEYPDFVPQIDALMRQPRVGDILVFAAPGYGFRAEHASGHGGPLREEMVVSHFWAGPDLPRGAEVPYARLLDFAPTVLELLTGAAPPASGALFEGRSRWRELVGAQPAR